MSGHDVLRRVAEARKSTFALYKEGVYIEQASSRSLEEMRHQVTADRLRLSETFLLAGDRFTRMRPAEYRSAISRYYYAMYHCMRAVVFFTSGGDDNQEHGTLPKHTPSDFPNAGIWENALKNARTTRNSADYDPYPETMTDWRQPAMDLAADATQLSLLASTYLNQKGCNYL